MRKQTSTLSLGLWVCLWCTLFLALSIPAKPQDSTHIKPYEWSISLQTEGTWNPRSGHAGWNNLLEISGGTKLWKGAALQAAAIATWNEGKKPAEDMQGLSNIDAGSDRAFRLTLGGLRQQLGQKLTLFAGLRNVDEDHFDTPFTGLFTGSSHGNFPVLSGNFPLATYPMATLSLHTEYAPFEGFTWKETVYNGVADDRIDRQFRFRPKKDGVFNIGSLNYSLPNENAYTGHYTLGYVLGTQPLEDEDNDTEHSTPLSYNYALWALGEQVIARMGNTQLGLMLQGGIAPTTRSACRYYWGSGLILDGITRHNAQIGVSVNRAIYADGTETDTELTGHFPVCSLFSVQPALHILRTNGKTEVAALLRLSLELGSN